MLACIKWLSEDFAYFLFNVGTKVNVNLGQIMFEYIVGYGNERKQGLKLPFPFLIYGVLATQKELKFDSKFLTKKKPLVTYRLMEKVKSKGEKSTSADPNATISTPTPADITTGPAWAALTQEVQ